MKQLSTGHFFRIILIGSVFYLPTQLISSTTADLIQPISIAKEGYPTLDGQYLSVIDLHNLKNNPEHFLNDLKNS